MPSGEFYENYWDNYVNESVRDDISERTGMSDDDIFQAHFDIAQDYMDDEWDAGQEHQFWVDYLDAMVDGTMSREEFFDTYDIDPADFDWDAWREAMGY